MAPQLLSKEKLAICTFTRTRFQPPNTIRISNLEIKYKTSVKYLGVILDKKLNWKEYISYICK